MIKFRCSGCSKAIGVEEEFGGRLIKCPACDNATRVPQTPNNSTPTVQSAEAPTVQHIPKVAIHPSCPSCRSELFNPSDTVCGVCGFLLEQTPISGVAPAADVPVATLDGADPSEQNLLVNPAIAKPHAPPSLGKHEAYDASHFSTPGPTTAGSVGALVAAVVVGLFCAVVWGVIASFFGDWAQVFAWAIGALVGCIAGLIARNPSVRFCLATTLGALLCMLFGRVVSAWVIMFSVSAMSAVGGFLVPDTGVTIGVMEQLTTNGEFEGSEKEYAEMKIETFFANKDIYEADGYDEVISDTEIAVDQRVREAVREMTPEEKQELLAKVRLDHPGWIEEYWHKQAVLDSLVQADKIENEDLRVLADVTLAKLDGESNSQYYANNPLSEINERELQLDEMVTEAFAAMNRKQKTEAFQNARKNHLSWTPVQHEYLAMLDRMLEDEEIPKELKSIAESEINLQLKATYDDTFGDLDQGPEDHVKSKRALAELVNERLLAMDQVEVNDLIAETKTKYPNWRPGNEIDIMAGLSEGLDDTIASFGSDGTFWGSLKTRFRTMDYVWITLGMISAYAIAFTLGQSRKKS